MLITFFASVLIWIMFLGVFFLWFASTKNRKKVLHAILAAFLAWGVSHMIKEFFPALRPFEINALDISTFTTPTDAGFPSSHTAVAFGMAVSLWYNKTRFSGVFVIAALLVGLARVWGNVHFPLDILGGVILGIFTATFVEEIDLGRLLKRSV